MIHYFDRRHLLPLIIADICHYDTFCKHHKVVFYEVCALKWRSMYSIKSYSGMTHGYMYRTMLDKVRMDLEVVDVYDNNSWTCWTII